MRKTVILGAAIMIAGAAAVAYLLFQPSAPSGPPSRAVPGDLAVARPTVPRAPESGAPTSPAGPAPTITEDDASGGPDADGANEGDAAHRVRVYGTVTDATTGQPIAGALLFTESYAMFARAVAGGGFDVPGDSAEETAELDQASESVMQGIPLPPELQEQLGAKNAVSDDSGAYSIEIDLESGPAVFCRAQGFAMDSRELSAGTPENFRVDFQLRKGASISGKVTNAANGAPAPDARVFATGPEPAMPWMMEMSDPLTVGTTDAAGEYRIDGLPAGQNTVMVNGGPAGWLFDTARAVHVTLAEGEEKTGVNLVVTEGLRVEGTITDEEGQPVEGATVEASPKSEDHFDFAQTIAGSFAAQSDESGHYTAVGLRPGVSSVTVQHEEYAKANGEVTVATGQATPRLDFTLVRGATVSGVAKYEDGTPAVYESVYLSSTKKEEGVAAFDSDVGEEMELTEEGTGGFTFKNVTAGEYRLAGTHPHTVGDDAAQPSSDDSVLVKVDGKTPVEGLEIVVKREKDERNMAGAITGTVLDGAGKPAPNVGVRAVSAEDEGETLPFPGIYGPDTTTDQAGAFTLEYLAGSRFTVHAESDTGEAMQANVKPGDTITLRLGPVTAVSGEVVDANAEPVARCGVSLTKPASEKAETMSAMMERMMSSFIPGEEGEKTDDFGRFTFRHIEAGNYIVEARSAGKGFGVSAPVSVTKGSEKGGIRIVLEAGVSFAGIVVDGSGNAVAGTNVSMIEATGSAMDEALSFLPDEMGAMGTAVTTGADGTFTLTGLKPGTYTLKAKHADFAPFFAKDIDVASAQATPYRITLGKGGAARGQFLVDGKPKGNVTVQFMGPGGMQMATTDSEGRFEVKGMATGTYMVMPMDFSGMSEGNAEEMPDFNFKSVTITEGGDAVVHFGGGVALTGSVPAEHLGKMTMLYLVRKGAPDMPTAFEGMDPMSMMDTGMQMMQYMAGMAEVKDDGSFNLTGVDPGEYEVRVYASDFDISEIESVDFLNMPIEEMQERSRQFAPKEVLRQPITVGDSPMTVEFPAPKAEAGP